jgi:Cu/Ag efflux protein CusF
MSKSLSIVLCFLITLQIFPLFDVPGFGGYAQAGGMVGSINVTVKKRFAGEVGEIDRDSKTITLVKKIGDKEFKMVFTFDDSTTVNFGKEVKTVGDLKSGDNVIASYITANGQNIVGNIVVEK